MNDENIVIASAKRTPIGSFQEVYQKLKLQN